jgi:hypothetical protein
MLLFLLMHALVFLLILVLLFTLTVLILSSTDIAKLIFASACHVIASFRLLYPKITGRTLLEPLFIGQLYEFPIPFVEFILQPFSLLTAYTSVSLLIALQTIMFTAGRTPEFL